jgi:hypothetical protein
MRQGTALVLALLLTSSTFAGAQAGSTAKPAKTVKKSATSSVTAELQQMKQALEAQQQQIQQLSEELKSRDQALQQVQQRLDQNQAVASQAQSKADTAVAQSGQQEQTVTALKSDVADLKTNVANTALTVQETQKNAAASVESPIALHFKGVTLTPGGFMVAETVYRPKATNADVNTPLNSIPFSGTTQGRLSEFNASGRQSRISMLVEGQLKGAKLTGYYETDFLSAGTTSNNNQSNSYTLRQRQFWGQAALSDGLSFTGGQMWSLVTETKKGMENRTEATPLTIDAQYTVGFSWARQYGFRVVKSFNNKAFLGFSIEGPQTTFGGHGFSNITTASTTNTTAGALITTSTVQNFVFGAAGTGGGLFNPTANYSFNRSPDFIVKAAFDPGWGHYEIFGVGSTFRDRAFPCAVVNAAHPCFINGSTKPSVVGAFNDSRLGGGVGANVRIPLIAKKLDFGVHGLFGDGIGRYGTASLPDATAHPDGTLSLVRGGQALATLELHPTPRWDIYVNAGVEYAARTAYPGYLVIKADGTSSFGAGGYGSRLFNNSGCSTETAPSNQFAPNSGTCNADTRLITEGTLGFWHRIYTGPYGKLQWGLQYSYLARSSWSGNNGIAPKAIENMFFTSFRYYLP